MNSVILHEFEISITLIIAIMIPIGIGDSDITHIGDIHIMEAIIHTGTLGIMIAFIVHTVIMVLGDYMDMVPITDTAYIIIGTILTIMDTDMVAVITTTTMPIIEEIITMATDAQEDQIPLIVAQVLQEQV